ncbi:interleukin-2 receptor subunit beta [Micropterus salmoides]|uniref:interleukin-2 receptor subunit beta n=1 Tax=Micropterus salmoides TaxID=27706 RepID=UPI0018EBB8C8|nr:interleukin-2 receptor subunit beta [Micropterus salmoides]
MQILWSLHVLVVLFSVDAAHSHKGSQGLSCVNDFVNNVSCTWTSSLVAPGVDCWISGVKKIWIFNNNNRIQDQMIRSCKLKKHGNPPPGCSFVFEKQEFSPFEMLPNISIQCNGTLVETLTNYKPCSHIKMHPLGVPNVSSTANETWISWSLSSPIPYLFSSFDFQIQIKQKTQTWKEAMVLAKQEFELRIPSWQLKGNFQVRVRVKPIKMSNCKESHWSNWSPNKASTPQDTDRLLDPMWGVMFSLGFIIFVMLIFYRSCINKGHLKRKPVPNPSKYFHTLHSVHGGNLKKWLNPLTSPESFFTVQPCDHISSVEVCESWDVAPSTSPSSSSTSALLHFRSYASAGSDTSGVVDNFCSSSSSSCFSNVGYFMSRSSSGSARTDPSPAYFTYQDDFHNLHNSHNLHVSVCPSLNTSPTYESLKREPQSPDSGFGICKEEEEGKEDKKVIVLEGDEALDDHEISPLFILPLHFPSRMCPPSSPPPPPTAPSLTQVSSDSQQVDVPVAAAGGSYAAWPLPIAMCRSSSMPVEPCKTGYLTLKELQTTFSNKSI